MQNFLDSNALKATQKSLDSLWVRQKVISNNIANIDTPGYKSKTVKFEEMLEKILISGEEKSAVRDRLSSLEPKILENDSTSLREDGNNVDIDSENIELARTQVQYEYMINIISSEISRMKYAINGGRG